MKKRILAIALVVAMVFSLTACGSSASTNTASGTTGAANTSNTAAGSTGGKTLKVGTNTAPQNISPFTNFTNRQPVVQYLYETLMARDTDGKFYGIIAKDWKTTDNMTYDINIYEDVYDTNGNQIKASDVVFSMEHARDDAANTWIKSCEATGDYSVRLTLTDSSVSTLPVAIERAPIVSQASYEASSDQMATSSVSTAPYMVTDFVPNVSITFEKNPNYWQKDAALQNPVYKNMTVDKLVYTKISEAAQQTIALETGTIDVFDGIANTEAANFLDGGRDASGFTALGYASPTSYCFYYANQGICGTDQNFRMAIASAINKDDIIAGVFNGLAAKPGFMGAPDGMSDLTPSDANPDTYFPYNLDQEKQYLAQSTYSGQKVRLLVPNEDNHNRIAAIVQGELLAIGINAEIESYDNAMFQSSFGDGSTWDIAICQMGMTDVAFVWSFLSYDLAGGDKGSMGMAVKDEQLKALLSKVLTVDGHNTENATAASDYINQMCYGQNLVSTKQYTVFRKDLNATDVPMQTMSTRYLSGTTFQ